MRLFFAYEHKKNSRKKRKEKDSNEQERAANNFGVFEHWTGDCTQHGDFSGALWIDGFYPIGTERERVAAECDFADHKRTKLDGGAQLGF